MTPDEPALVYSCWLT